MFKYGSAPPPGVFKGAMKILPITEHFNMHMPPPLWMCKTCVCNACVLYTYMYRLYVYELHVQY